MGGFDEKAVKKALNIPGGRKVAAIIALGYPDKAEAKRERERVPLESMSSFNGWENV
jgi:nitroreductase